MFAGTGRQRKHAVWEMETVQLQTKIDTFEDMEDIKLASRLHKSDEHQEKVSKFALQEHAQLQESAYEPELEAARSLKAQKLEELFALEHKYEELDRMDAEVNDRFEKLSQLKVKIAAAKEWSQRGSQRRVCHSVREQHETSTAAQRHALHHAHATVTTAV
ncbi:hypothetical protein SARC_00620 [Sphaeroforma arctica JP610]|uniref:Uncharacterized protein n=1 Tax=Sphaeroforma arctica JP610 TaxID=667725 RepID=A0A0L0GG74_9EUKA|nr:hypothetical protein SARC_00620 [Sphaeroforma arctica JP610]KNC87293.1 hypothetical protein SARC_00620 [Sphaeroforma arctica JP610]|eukprot:XP_014161195.1 hypothetical protein SARC_00620 [Sphaeroforma arctica JP610]